jgi:pimeloyl-ACP methyl ester carboxylesterase
MNKQFKILFLCLVFVFLDVNYLTTDEKFQPQSFFITVNDIKLHYLNYGGEGETLIFLSGLGDTGYVFNDIAKEFVDNFRVYSLTRRGHGQSEKAEEGYDIDTLVEDIFQFIEVMNFDRVILAGHSFAGDELTRFAVLHPSRVKKLIYLDSGYDYFSLSDLMAKMPKGFTPAEEDLASLKAYRKWFKTKALGFWSNALDENLRKSITVLPDGSVKNVTPAYVYGAILQGCKAWKRDFSKIQCPVLSIYALQGTYTINLVSSYNKKLGKEFEDVFKKFYEPWQQNSVNRFKNEIKNCKIIVLLNTSHHCFIHKKDKVVLEMKDFLEVN